MVMETPSPQCVGREFVRQYYTLLNEAPMHLHRFYSHNSCFVHGGVEKPGEEQPPVMGQAEIHKKIISLNFRDCHAKIRQVDSQATVGNAVVVQVTGELSNSGQPMRRFMQTFVLVPQSPKKYYVHNDIFRYQDEVFHDNDTDNEIQDEAVDSEPEVLPIEPSPQPVTTLEPESPPAGAQVNVNYYETTPPAPMSNGSAHLEERVESPEPVVKDEEEEEPEPKMEEEPQPPVTEPYEPKTQEKTPEPEPEPEQPAGPQAPVTWAAMLSKTPGGPVAPSSQPVAPVKQAAPVISKPMEMPKSEPSGPPPQPQRNPRPPRDRGTRERDGSRSAGDSDEGSRRPPPRYPDNQQIFVGNLPQTMSEKELKTYFEDYGKVAELRINKKGGSPAVPGYGFVVFEEAKTVERVLAHKGPFLIQGGHRLNVEEKKQRGDTGRPGSGSRGGRGGMGGMGRGGSMMGRGGRGGNMGMGGGRTDNRGGGRGGFGGPRR
jgi:Ras GTPase-activating protein-binding protein 1